MQDTTRLENLEITFTVNLTLKAPAATLTCLPLYQPKNILIDSAYNLTGHVNTGHFVPLVLVKNGIE